MSEHESERGRKKNKPNHLFFMEKGERVNENKRGNKIEEKRLKTINAKIGNKRDKNWLGCIVIFIECENDHKVCEEKSEEGGGEKKM